MSSLHCYRWLLLLLSRQSVRWMSRRSADDVQQIYALDLRHLCCWCFRLWRPWHSVHNIQVLLSTAPAVLYDEKKNLLNAMNTLRMSPQGMSSTSVSKHRASSHCTLRDVLRKRSEHLWTWTKCSDDYPIITHIFLILNWLKNKMVFIVVVSFLFHRQTTNENT